MDHSQWKILFAERLVGDRQLADRLAYYYDHLRAQPRRWRRRAGRRARLSLAAVALMLALSHAPGTPAARAETAATITVANGVVLVAADGQCSLFEAVNNANDTIDGMGNKPGHSDCAAGNPAGVDVIALPAGGSFTVTTYSDKGYYYTALPPITTTITVEGNGATITVDSDDPMRLFTVYGNETGSAALTLNNLTITGANAEFNGGAVYAYSAALTVNNCTITGNTAEAGGGIAAYGSAVTITGSTIDGNTGEYGGGGLYIDSGTLHISDSTISGNEAKNDSSGGGIYALTLDFTLDKATVTKNSARFGAGINLNGAEGTISNSAITGNTGVSGGKGGALYVADSILALTGTELSGNKTSLGAGAIVLGGEVTLSGGKVVNNEADATGGALYLNNGILTVDGTLINGNSAKYWGGGIYMRQATLTLTGATISGNAAEQNGGGLTVAGPDSVVQVNGGSIAANEAGDAAGGLYQIDGSVTLAAATVSGNEAPTGGGVLIVGGTLAIDGGGVESNKATTGAGLAVKGGVVTFDGGRLKANAATGNGGGAINQGATLTFDGTTIEGNSAGQKGGGVFNEAAAATTTLTGVTLTGNTAGSGGGLAVGGGTTTVQGGTLQGNTVTGEGGGAFASGGALTIAEVTLSGNKASSGGGIFVYGGTVDVDQSTLRANEAGDGGGVRAGLNGTIAITNSTLSANKAGVSGGGLHNAGTMTLTNVTVTGNTAGVSGGGGEVYAGTLTLRRSLIAGNSAQAGRELRRQGGVIKVNDRNLFGFGGNSGLDGLSAGATDVVPSVPLTAILGPLADNGGPTLTHALPANSPAIDRAPSADCASAPVNGVDQRGQPRNLDGNGLPSANECDIGAFEAAEGEPPPPMDFTIMLPVVLRAGN